MNPASRYGPGLILLSLCSAVLSAQSSAAPTHGQLRAGDASISQEGNTLRIEQRSPRAILSWANFNIAGNERVVFVQPGADAVVLNRIVSPDPSSIQGSLTANGRVFLANPNGIVFGPGAQVSVAGLVATTADIADQNFMAGDFKFRLPGNGGAIVNQGSITAAPGGRVALLGRTVQNPGTITAQGGAVVLATGDVFLVDLFGDGLISVASAIKRPMPPPPQSSPIAEVGTVNVGSGVLVVRRVSGELTGTLNGTPIEQAAQTAVPLIGGGLAFVGQPSLEAVQYGAPTWLLSDASSPFTGVGGQVGGMFDVTPVYTVRVEPGSVTTPGGQDPVAGVSGLSQFNRLGRLTRLWAWDEENVPAEVDIQSQHTPLVPSAPSVRSDAVVLAQTPRVDKPGSKEPARTRGAVSLAGKRYCTVREVARSASTGASCRGG